MESNQKIILAFILGALFLPLIRLLLHLLNSGNKPKPESSSKPPVARLFDFGYAMDPDGGIYLSDMAKALSSRRETIEELNAFAIPRLCPLENEEETKRKSSSS